MIYTVYKSVGLGMGAVARELHETAQAVTDDIMRYRSIALNCRHFDDTWKRIKAVRRVISDISGQIDQRAQYVETVVLMCDLNPPQNEASWKLIETVCVWFPTSPPKLTVELNGSRYALLHWWDCRMKPHRWMPRMSPVAKSGDVHYNSVAFHDTNRYAQKWWKR